MVFTGHKSVREVTKDHLKKYSNKKTGDFDDSSWQEIKRQLVKKVVWKVAEARILDGLNNF